MKSILKKPLSVILVLAFIITTAVTGFAVQNVPVFALSVNSFEGTTLSVSLNLVSGKFNSADIAFAAEGLTCTKISKGELLSEFQSETEASVYCASVKMVADKPNVAFASSETYSAVGEFLKITFTVKNPDNFSFSVSFPACDIRYDDGTIESVVPVIENSVSSSSLFSVKGVCVKKNIEMILFDSSDIGMIVDADEGASYTVSYSSSDEKIATVDEKGTVYGANTGEADITCTVTDSSGNTFSDVCRVKVRYSMQQWIAVLFILRIVWLIKSSLGIA